MEISELDLCKMVLTKVFFRSGAMWSVVKYILTLHVGLTMMGGWLD